MTDGKREFPVEDIRVLSWYENISSHDDYYVKKDQHSSMISIFFWLEEEPLIKDEVLWLRNRSLK